NAIPNQKIDLPRCKARYSSVFYLAYGEIRTRTVALHEAGYPKRDNATMTNETYTQPHHVEDVEIQEWLETLDSVLESSGPEVAAEILERLRAHAKVSGIELPFTANTPYANTIPARLEPLFPGDQELERRIKSLIRWNALAMVVRANREEHNIGGHI